MEEKIISFRADKETERKLSVLQKKDSEERKTEGELPRARSDLIREAVDFYYMFTVSEESNDFFLCRVSIVMKDVMRQVMPEVMRSLNSLQYSSMVIQQLVRQICMAVDFPGSEAEWMNMLEKENKYDLCAEKIVNEIVKRTEEEDEHERTGTGNE